MRFRVSSCAAVPEGGQRGIHGALVAARLDLVEPVDLALADLLADLEEMHPQRLVVGIVVDSDDDPLLPFDLRWTTRKRPDR